MKLSNKILIGFATAFFLIPLIIMGFQSQVNYKTGTVEAADMARRKDNYRFDNPSENMTSIPLKAFRRVKMADAQGNAYSFHFIKDDKFGVKIGNEFKDIISFNVSDSGDLEILAKSLQKNKYAEILIYGPSVSEFSIANVDALWLDAKSDSLIINAKKLQSITLNSDISLNSLSIITDQVKEIITGDLNMKVLKLDLNGTNFSSQRSSYELLDITATSDAKIEINGENKHSIKRLQINTRDLVSFNLKDIKVEQCSGSFSDDTKVEMPAVNLKQMFAN